MIVPITVLMSVYNGERWLHESIESILGQTFTEFEFIIVNDGSKDKSLEIIKKFASKDQRIRIIDKINTGLADSLNVGIAESKGEWIARLDADDICEVNRLESQYSVGKSRNELVLIGSGHSEIDAGGLREKIHIYPNTHETLVRRLLKKKAFFSHSSAFFRTSVVKKLGCYRARIKRAEDYDLWLRMSEVGQLDCVSKPLVNIRHHSGQISHDEAGEKQVIDSYVALVSHLLREKGFVDPVSNVYDDFQFERFREHIKKVMRRENVFELHQFVRSLKYSYKKNGLLQILNDHKLSGSLLNYICRYIRFTVAGDEISKKITRDWVAKIAEKL